MFIYRDLLLSILGRVVHVPSWRQFSQCKEERTGLWHASSWLTA